MSQNSSENLLWDEYGPAIINALNLKETSKGEWHGPCPNCGGKDRFWINEHKGELYAHCRQCQDFSVIKDAMRDQGLLPRWEADSGPQQSNPRHKSSVNEKPYHIRKKIDLDLGECRLDNDKLVVNITDILTGEARGTQTITNDQKLFTKGMIKEGAGTFIGARTDKLVACEGFATAQAVHKATGYQALFSLDSATVPKNVALLKQQDPDRKIIVGADNDDEGKKAAQKAGVPYSLPNQAGADWHDVFMRDGAAAAKDQFKQNLRSSEIDIQDNEPNPVDLWGKYGPPDLPLGVLPPLIEEFAQTQSKLTGADASGFAMAALSVCSAAMDDCNKLRVKRHDQNWTESARLWVGIVGDPSTKKTPIISAASKPLCEIDNALFKKYCEERKQWESTDAKDRRGQEPPKQVRKRLEDATPEAAQQVLEHSPSGLLCLQDELSGFFGAMDKYNGGKGAMADRGFWLRSFNGGEYALNRVSRGAVLIPNLSINLLGGIQPEPLRMIANGSQDDGLLQRMIVVVLKPAEQGVDQPVPEVTGRYRTLIRTIYDGAGVSFGGHAPYEFAPDAQAYRTEMEGYFHSLMRVEVVNKKLTAHIGKYDGLFARFCLLWHHIECAGGNVPGIIPLSLAKRVGAFFKQFILPHAIAFYGTTLGLSDDHDRLTSMAGHILAHNKDMLKLRDVHRGDRNMRKLDSRTARALFEQLEALGWGSVLPEAKMGTSPAFQVNPQVHSKFRKRAEQERKRREAVQLAISQVTANQ